MLTRRTAIASIAAAAASPCALIAAPASNLEQTLAGLEAKSKGRLGVAVLFPSGRRAAHRADERFPMCSTFKFLAAALVLHRADRKQEQLDRIVTYTKDDLVPNSPETEKHATPPNAPARPTTSDPGLALPFGMTISQLCLAAIRLSDNTAANLLLQSFGGAAALTAFARSIGDPVTRLDRTETSLNEGTPGDPRDTTTPNAMLGNLQKILFGSVFSEPSRVLLTDWMLANTTGKQKFVAGLGEGWKVADKTGAGDHGSNNDIGVLYPPAGRPILVASYLTEADTISNDDRNAIHADVARAIAASSN